MTQTRDAGPVEPVPEPAGHDDEDPGEPAEEPRHRDRRQPLAEEHPPERRDAERQRAGDDRREPRLDRPHREVEKPEIERVLADAEDDDRAPLGRGQPDALPEREADAERERPRRTGTAP